MTDLEMMKAAAKAAGIAIGAWRDELGAFLYRDAQLGKGAWNPRDDDGDSRRLEVVLRMEVSVGDDSTTVTDQYGAIEIVEPHNGDACAATRLAVLKCAAAIADSATP